MKLILKLQARVVRESTCERYRHGTIIYDRQFSEIVAVGTNVRTYPPMIKRSFHSEEIALLRANKRGFYTYLSELHVINIRMNQSGELGLAAPCYSCDRLLRVWMNIPSRNIWWTV